MSFENRKRLLIGAVILAVVVIAGILFTPALRRATATEYKISTSPDGKYKIIVYRMRDFSFRMPGQYSDAPGYVRLFDSNPPQFRTTRKWRFGSFWVNRSLWVSVPQSVAWPLFVVFLEPLFSLFAHLIQSCQQVHVDHRLAVASIESFDKAVCIGLPDLMNSSVTPTAWPIQPEPKNMSSRPLSNLSLSG